MITKCINKHECIRPLTFEPLELCLTPVLAQRREELVHLLEGQWVVQCLQWIDGGHQGATFKPCSRFQIQWQPSLQISHKHSLSSCTRDNQANLMWPTSTLWPHKLNPTPFSHLVSRTVFRGQLQPKISKMEQQHHDATKIAFYHVVGFGHIRIFKINLREIKTSSRTLVY